MTISQRSGAMASMEVLTGDIEYFTLYTKIDITKTGNFADDTQKDFEAILQVIALRAMPVIMNNAVFINGVGSNTLDNFGAPTLTGEGYIFKFAFEREGVHTIDTLKDELDGIVLNGGTVRTLSSVNTEFTKQDLL